ncbi:MAG: hypothetical protein QOK43_623 [Acidimicrobiaceae bacterium]|nr:hypothetical protein [Acidimicrobiaceae bacterium]
MPGSLTVVTELATALGTLAADVGAAAALEARPKELRHVSDVVWTDMVDSLADRAHAAAFHAAFANGVALLRSSDGLRGRRPALVEWKGPHKPPGDDVIPADIRIDHVYLVSCKYLSKIMLNPGPSRLFDRLLVGEDRSPADWFAVVAPLEYQAFYDDVRAHFGLTAALPGRVEQLSAGDRLVLRDALRARVLPAPLQVSWEHLCAAVSAVSAQRWRAGLGDAKARLRLLWRLLRIGQASYCVLGADRESHVRLRIGSTWDWVQEHELRGFDVAPIKAGQPEVGWYASVRERSTGRDVAVRGHVEVRWSHGRFGGSPEAKVYLDTPHAEVPGYYGLSEGASVPWEVG